MQHRSALDIESITIIDECDEDVDSPNRGEHKNPKFECTSHEDIKLRNQSAKCANRNKEVRIEQYSFYFESNSSKSSNEKKGE